MPAAYRNPSETPTWMNYMIAPLWGRGGIEGQFRHEAMPFYAANLEHAFTQARCTWPSAQGWTWIGIETGENWS